MTARQKFIEARQVFAISPQKITTPRQVDGRQRQDFPIWWQDFPTTRQTDAFWRQDFNGARQADRMTRQKIPGEKQTCLASPEVVNSTDKPGCM